MEIWQYSHYCLWAKKFKSVISTGSKCVIQAQGSEMGLYWLPHLILFCNLGLIFDMLLLYLLYCTFYKPFYKHCEQELQMQYFEINVLNKTNNVLKSRNVEQVSPATKLSAIAIRSSMNQNSPSEHDQWQFSLSLTVAIASCWRMDTGYSILPFPIVCSHSSTVRSQGVHS